MLSDYLPVVVLAALAMLFAVGSLAASAMLRPHRPTPAKLSPYECGIEPERLPKGERFSVKFYVVAILFVVFDIEAVFLYPWAVVLAPDPATNAAGLGWPGLVTMGIFVATLIAGLVYVWKKGVLDWSK